VTRAALPSLLLGAAAALGAGAAGEPGTRLADLAWPAAEKLLRPERVVVLPLGAASKEHGPHLPLGADFIEAEYLAGRVLQARPVALLPTLSYGFYPAFLEYPGSVSLSFDTQRDVVVEICRSLAGYGPRRFYVLNTGVSTARPLRAAQEQLAQEGLLMRFTDVIAALQGVESRVAKQAYGTHADEIETSMLLYMQPSAVDMRKAVKDGVDKPGPLTRDPAQKDRCYSPSGVFGDATLATRDKGRQVTEELLAAVLRDLDALQALPLPAGTPRSPLAPAAPAAP
jgi:creatinine amidohydrolase